MPAGRLCDFVSLWASFRIERFHYKSTALAGTKTQLHFKVCPKKSEIRNLKFIDYLCFNFREESFIKAGIKINGRIRALYRTMAPEKVIVYPAINKNDIE